jgi:hypothetical protein
MRRGAERNVPRERASAKRLLRRRWCLVAALTLPYLAFACDDGGDPVPPSSGGGNRAGGGGTDLATGHAGAPVGNATGGANGVLGGESEARGGAAASAGGGSGTPGMTEGGAGGAGSLSARLARYHRAESDRALRFELDAVEGLEPYPTSVDYLTSLTGRVLPKPDGISFDHDETLPAFGDAHVWTFGELDEFSRLHAGDDAAGPVSIHVLFVDGRYDSGEGAGTVLGLAWGERYIALFQDAIRAGCSGVLGPLQTETCEVAERSVWAHELGHIIGLVDNGISQRAPHRDLDHGRHDVSDGCLMYWAYDGPQIFDLLLSRLETGQGPDIDFCELCWADLNGAQP